MNVYEAPQRLEPSDFEDWIWRREKLKKPGQLADFRYRATFPGCNNLPHENHIDPEFYATVDEFTHRPRRHWLFLGEIVNFGSLLRLQMTIKEVDSMTIPLFFYTEGRGSELEISLIQKGYTVAILYAEFHAFAFSEPGIRLEEPIHIKVFPLSLDKLLALSDRVPKFSMEINGTRICHGCDKQAASLNKCATCSLFWHCSRACQSTGWNEKAHKADCKLLKDTDLNRLFSLDWDDFKGHIGFPLNSVQ